MLQGLCRGGGNRRLASLNHGLHLFLGCLDAKKHRGKVCYDNKNILSLGRESKRLSATSYACERGLKRHTEDNSPKYRMVGKMISILRSFACAQDDVLPNETVITRSDERRSNRIQNEKDEIATFRCTPLAKTDKRLRNKCAMTWNSDMEENNFTDKVFSRFTSHFSLRKAAFTLAEVLVTLGIIGVVSAMTVPTLMQNYQRQSYVTQLHKTYNEMSQALLRYQTDRNAINLTEAGLTDINSLDSFMKNYFKIVKDCGMDETACFGSNYKKIDGSSINFMSTDSDGVRAYVLANGASIAIISGSNYFHLDVNGKKGPNIVGRDTFAIKIHSNGLLDELCNSAPCSAEEREQLFTNHCIKSSSLWWGCFGKILNDNWQMNY